MQTLNKLIDQYNSAIRNKEYATAASIAADIIEHCDNALSGSSDLNPIFEGRFTATRNSVKGFLDNYNAGMFATLNPPISSDSSNKETGYFSKTSEYRLPDIANDKIRKDFIINFFGPSDPTFGDIIKRLNVTPYNDLLLYGADKEELSLVAKGLAGQLGANYAEFSLTCLFDSFDKFSELIDSVINQALELKSCVIIFKDFELVSFDTPDLYQKAMYLFDAIDKFIDTSSGTTRLLVATSTHPYDIVESAFDGGRFGQALFVPPLTDSNIEKILSKDFIDKIPCSDDVSVQEMAHLFSGYSRRDIKTACSQICKEAAIREITAKQRGAESSVLVTMEDIRKVSASFHKSISDETICSLEAYSIKMELEEFINMIMEALSQSKPALGLPHSIRYVKSRLTLNGFPT